MGQARSLFPARIQHSLRLPTRSVVSKSHFPVGEIIGMRLGSRDNGLEIGGGEMLPVRSPVILLAFPFAFIKIIQAVRLFTLLGCFLSHMPNAFDPSKKKGFYAPGLELQSKLELKEIFI